MMMTHIADMLKTYRSEVDGELTAILAFWQANAVDVSQGGFVGQMDNNGKINRQAPKGCVLNARILWTFSAAFRHTGKREHRMVAQKAYDYLADHFLDKEYGGVYWSVDASGQPLNTRKQIYALAFAIYGLTEYFRAVKQPLALKASQELFQWIEAHSYDEKKGGYLEACDREGKLPDDLRLSEKDRNDPKTMNTHLHILEAYTNLYRVWPDPFLAQQLEGLLTVFLEHIVDADTGHLKLFFTRDWAVNSSLVSFGHEIEASWLLSEAAAALGREALIKKIKTVSEDLAVAAGEGLQPDGSLFHEYDRATGDYDKHREWWVSAEAMAGFLNAYQVSGEPAFLTKSWDAWQFVRKHLLDKEKGEWFWGVLDDYSIMKSEDKIGFWKCPYHNARACMEVVSRCEAALAGFQGGSGDSN